MSDSEAIVIARFYREGGKVRLEPLVPREDLPGLIICTKHPDAVYYDGPVCPCCKIIKELALHRTEQRRIERERDRLTKGF